MKVNPAPFVDNIFITSPLTKGEVGKSTKGAGSTLERGNQGRYNLLARTS